MLLGAQPVLPPSLMLFAAYMCLSQLWDMGGPHFARAIKLHGEILHALAIKSHGEKLHALASMHLERMSISSGGTLNDLNYVSYSKLRIQFFSVFSE